MKMNRETLASLIVVFLGSIALFGWWVDHATLALWLPSIADMTFNTALLFVLAGMTCLLAKNGENFRLIRLVITAILMVYAVLSLAEDIWNISLGIDQLFFSVDAGATSSPHPGRMSPVTASGFLLVGLSLIGLYAGKTYKIFVHISILLLVLLALLGMAMQFVMFNVPETYAHLSSISLLTATAFLLLAYVLLRMFSRCYAISSDVFLYSGVGLMYRLKYPQKFALISLVFAVPLALLMWNKLDNLDAKVKATQLKLLGIEHIKETARLLKAIPEHRGMKHASLFDEHAFQGALQAKEKEIDSLFVSNDRMDRLQASMIAVPDEWQTIEQHWKQLKQHKGEALLSWRLHTEMIALLQKHLRDVGRQTLLSYDSNPMIHNYLTMRLEVMPKLLEELAQLRGMGSGMIANKVQGDFSPFSLASKLSNVSLLLHETQPLLYADKYSNPPAAMQRDFSKFVDASELFVKTTKQKLLMNQAVTISVEDYFRMATQAITYGSQFNRSTMQVIEQVFHQRIRDSITEQYVIKLMAIFVALFVLFLFAAFYKSVMNTIRALSSVSEEMRAGDMHGRLDIPNRDEMHSIVHSFDGIAKDLLRVSSHMRAVVDHAVDGIISMNHLGEIKSFNPAAEHIFQMSEAEALGKSVAVLMPDRYRSRHEQGLKRYLAEGSSDVLGKSLEVFGQRSNGEEFPMELSIVEMTIDNQQMFLGMVRDISEFHELEMTLRHAQKMEAVGALVGGVAHNFNNLLAAIVGKAYLGKRKAAGMEDVVPYFDSIESISSQAGDMIKQLLTFARKDFFVEKQDMALDILLKETFKTSSLAIPEDIAVDLQLIDLNMIVHIDANQIQQVVMNMMNNARDALRDSSVKKLTVRLELYKPDANFFNKHSSLAAGDYACLSISDTGHGIDIDIQEKIFDPFFTTKEEGKGTGLGLSTAFGTIASHHGTIEVESSVGKGTCFSIYLPLVEAAEKIVHVDSTKEVEVAVGIGSKTLLLVDDEVLVLHAIQEVLEELGYSVLTAHDGKQGLACFENHKQSIDAVISDVVMPEMDGPTMLHKLREKRADMPAILMTGYDEGKVQLSAYDLDKTEVLAKPISIATLSQTLDKLLA